MRIVLLMLLALRLETIEQATLGFVLAFPPEQTA